MQTQMKKETVKLLALSLPQQQDTDKSSNKSSILKIASISDSHGLTPAGN